MQGDEVLLVGVPDLLLGDLDGVSHEPPVGHVREHALRVLAHLGAVREIERAVDRPRQPGQDLLVGHGVEELETPRAVGLGSVLGVGGVPVLAELPDRETSLIHAAEDGRVREELPGVGHAVHEAHGLAVPPEGFLGAGRGCGGRGSGIPGLQGRVRGEGHGSEQEQAEDGERATHHALLRWVARRTGPGWGVEGRKKSSGGAGGGQAPPAAAAVLRPPAPPCGHARGAGMRRGRCRPPV